MLLLRTLLIGLVCVMASGCKIEVNVPEGGEVVSVSGANDCGEGSTCEIDVVDLFFEETFTPVPAEGHAFTGWAKRDRGLCGGTTEPCQLTTSGFEGNDALLAFLTSEEIFYLQPVFAPERPSGVGFEILEFQQDGSLRVWLTTAITEEEFGAIDLPSGWIRNQPRVGEPDGGRFYQSPPEDEPGSFVEAELFGFSWRHVATVVQRNAPVEDAEGLLTGALVAKFHEVSFDAGRNLVILLSPSGDPYVRISRDLNRPTDDPTIPSGWDLVDVTLEETLVIRLPDETLVIRADNEDSFQGPVPEIAALL